MIAQPVSNQFRLKWIVKPAARRDLGLTSLLQTRLQYVGIYVHLRNIFFRCHCMMSRSKEYLLLRNTACTAKTNYKNAVLVQYFHFVQSIHVSSPSISPSLSLSPGARLRRRGQADQTARVLADQTARGR